MTALRAAHTLCSELDRRRANYELKIVRDALMVMVSVPGERWEIEFFDDGRVEVERFISQGVSEDQDAATRVLEYFDD